MRRESIDGCPPLKMISQCAIVGAGAAVAAAEAAAEAADEAADEPADAVAGEVVEAAGAGAGRRESRKWSASAAWGSSSEGCAAAVVSGAPSHAPPTTESWQTRRRRLAETLCTWRERAYLG